MFWNRKKKAANSEPLAVEKKTKPQKTLPLPFLKRLIPIGRLADTELKQLTVTLSHFKPGNTIFTQSEPTDSLTYIIKGICFVEVSNGLGYEIDATTFKSYYPLSSHSENQCTAIAKTDVTVIHFPQKTLHRSSATNTRNPLLNSEDIPDSLKENAFFNAFCQHFNQQKLFIPSLPDIAIKLRMAVQKNIGVSEAVKIINLDPVISSKLIRIVNSPLYRAANPISSCHDAVTRLGLTTTRNLVTSISMKNLFKSKNTELNKIILMLWKQSIQISSISHTLALHTEQINPDEALLAGLVHNIGAIPIVIFADSLNSEDYSNQDINHTITNLQGLLGNFILDNWGFPELLKQIPTKTENWYHNDNETLDLSDVVLLAKFHSYIGTKQMQKLPPIHTLPAFQKLGNNALTPDMSLKTLHDAKQQISESLSLFGA